MKMLKLLVIATICMVMATSANELADSLEEEEYS